MLLLLLDRDLRLVVPPLLELQRLGPLVPVSCLWFRTCNPWAPFFRLCPPARVPVVPALLQLQCFSLLMWSEWALDCPELVEKRGKKYQKCGCLVWDRTRKKRQAS